ncbi:MAG: alpha/beta hydrolase family protein [Patescibacteria group bacterium]
MFKFQENLVFEAKFMFTDRNYMGDGIGVGFTNSSGYPLYQFAVWNGINDNTIFIHNDFNNSFYNYCNVANSRDGLYGRGITPLEIRDGEWHVLRIEKTAKKYKVYIDKDINDVPIFSSADNQCIPEVVFLGNPLEGGSSTWTSLNVDYVRIHDGTYELPERNKIIVLPGLGASWNEKAMVFNQIVAANEWKMTLFVRNYDSLVGALEQNGLVKGSDYFVWSYDWRKPLADIVTDFNVFISGLGISSGDQIDLVGHSLGGLVARIWTQENPDKVGKVLTLGSPHAGAVKAYEAWNGASVGDKFDAQSIALNVFLQLQKRNNQNLVDTVRNYAKILKDLLPTFNYLKVNGKIKIPPENLYLSGKNTTVSNIFEKFTAVVGRGEQTKEWINLGERSIFDKILGLWEQGKPVSFLYGEGDGTVLKKSAKFEGDIYVEKASEHGTISDRSVNFVLSELGLGKTIVEIAVQNDPMAVFYLGSPAKMTVNCNGGVGVTDAEGWVTMANKNIADCQVGLLGTGSGTYHLVMGNSSDGSSWQYSEGEIGVGETKNISIVDKNFWYDQVLRETNELLGQFGGNKNLLIMKTAVEGKNLNQLLDAYIAFRKEKKETKITLGTVNYLEKILGIEKAGVNGNELEKARINALSFKSLADRTALLLQRRRINPTNWQSLNYSQAEGLLNNPSYARYFLAGKIFEIVWK